MAVLASVYSGIASAQTTPSNVPTYSVAFVGVPLSEALTRIVDDTRISIAYETERVRGPITHCKAVDLTADELLTCLLRGTGLDYIRLSSGTYVIVEGARAPPRLGSLVGRVLDAETLAPLADANLLLEHDDVGSATNTDGRFSFANLSPGTHRLVVTHVAYNDDYFEVVVSPGGSTALDIRLTPRVVSSAPIVVNGFEQRLPMAALGVGQPAPGSELVQGAGTPDLIQNLASISGVHLGSGMSDVHVQGGDTGEQQFRLDGMPIFLPISNAGFFGPFSPQAIGNITVRKAGFGATYGSGLSSVVDLTHRLAPGEGLSGLVTADPMSANVRLSGSGHLGHGIEAAWMIGGRKSLWDVWGSHRLKNLFADWGTADSFLSQTLGVTGPGTVATSGNTPSVEIDFDAIHAASRIQFSGFRSLTLSYFQGHNSFGIEDVSLADNESVLTFTDTYEWKNRAAQIRYEWVASARLLVSMSAWLTKYELSRPTLSNLRDSLFIEDFNEISQSGARVGWQLTAGSRHFLSASADVSRMWSKFAFSLDPLGETVSDAGNIRPADVILSGHVDDRVSVSSTTTLTIGSRFTYLPGQRRILAEPRLELLHDQRVGMGTAAFRLAVGRYRQYLNSFDVTTSGIATLLPVLRYWLPVGENQAVPEAYHFAGGAIYSPAATWQLGLDAYYKYQPILLVPDYERSSPTDPVLTNARGYAYGAAVSATRETHGLRLETRYEFEHTRRRLSDRFGGRYEPAPWETPHRILVSVYATPVKPLTTSIRWQVWFGRSWAYRQSYYDYLEPNPETTQFGTVDLSEPDRHVLPAFSQLDVGAGWNFMAKGVDVELKGSITNLLGRHNVNDWSLSDSDPQAGYIHIPRLSTPFLPSLSISASW